MDRRSWLWRKKSSEKSPGETESSGSISSHSERCSDDQETSRASPNHNTLSPEITSKVTASSEEVNDNVKSLTDKLAAALSNISAKEDLVKQHAKVAEEAVSGWEKAENEVVALKQKLESATQKNSTLEDRVSHLDGALKECVRQLRQAREEQEQKIHEAVVEKTKEWESVKLELESQVVNLQSQVEAAKLEAAANSDLCSKLESAEKKNAALKLELLSRVEELEIRTLERDLSTQTAETASKQHLESIKKVAKLEAECRRLRAMSRKAPSANDHRSVTASSFYVESLTDSQSDSGERLLGMEIDTHKMSSMELNDGEASYSDSWASALIAELDQFKQDKAIGRNLTTSSVEIDLMDDFLEMERLAALPETESGDPEPVAVPDQIDRGESSLKAELETMIQRSVELEEKLEKLEEEKAQLNIALAETQSQLEMSNNQLKTAEEKLVELQRCLDLANNLKQTTEEKLETINTQKEVIESRLVGADAEIRALRGKVGSLESEIEKERTLSEEIVVKCRKLEDELTKKKHEAELWRASRSNGELKIKQEKELAVAAGKLTECQKTIASLGRQLKSLATLEDFLIDYEKPLDLTVGSPIPKGGDLWKLHSNDAHLPKAEAYSSKIAGDGSGPSTNGKNGESPPSSSSSSSSSALNHAVASEKSQNGFGKLFSRGKSSIPVENK
ncbi:PREDICTED: filament-like plant protein isoform X2 [Nelumbo nucifera]|uniref:Filament-like plant protein isoform X2 n=1 Tax=Nelumbo nucifera TaxID=4432 RepID=A0A1U7Z770_NELNU|nr:PREDICTED: filament-like plant protein isoform X2 [Nelumbo nucifera]